MAPSDNQLEGILRNTVEEVYRSDKQDDLTVRFVRDKVEHDLGLAHGFFSTPEWKDKSKLLIKSWATKLIDDEERLEVVPASIETKPKLETKPSIQKSKPSPKKGTARPSHNAKPPPKRRQKKEETPSEDAIDVSTEERVISDFKDSDDSEPSKVTKKTKSKPRAQVKRQSKKRAKDESDESEADHTSAPPFVDSNEDREVKPNPRKKAKTEVGNRRRSQITKIESDEESEEEHKKIKKSAVKSGIQPTPTRLEDSDEKSPIKDDDSDSETAMMMDEKPKPKQKRRSKSETSSSKSSKPRASPKELSADEVQIKTLQSQLTKCGVRKIWGIELKKFAGDDKKKIRHLQGMLRDVGMTGRFSEQRAKEIKELRELQADLAAVTEGDSKWGLQSGKRARAQRKSFQEMSDGDEDEGAHDGGDRKDASDDKAARVKRELAFLGDEESESD